MRKFVVPVFILALMVSVAAADTLKLKNGSSVDGTFLGGDSRQVKFLDSSGSVKTYAVNDVSTITFGDGVHGAAQASESIAAPKPVRARQAVAAPTPPTAPTPPPPSVAIPAGTVVTIRMIDSIDSDFTGVGERFRASLDESIIVDGREIAPRGSDAQVEVARVEQAGQVRGREEITVELATITINGQLVDVESDFQDVEGKGKTGKTAKRAGVGAAAGAVLGGIIGGGKGAVIGAGAGAGAGTVYSATRGEKVRIPSETRLTFALRQDVKL